MATAAVVLAVPACTHTTHLDPAGPSIQNARAALAQRRATVTTLDDRLVLIDQSALTASAITGRSVRTAESFAAPLGEVHSISYRSRARGAWDWFLLGAAVNTAGLATIVADEAGSAPDWGLFALVVAGATVPYAVVGAILGSTIRFQLLP